MNYLTVNHPPAPEIPSARPLDVRVPVRRPDGRGAVRAAVVVLPTAPEERGQTAGAHAVGVRPAAGAVGVHVVVTHGRALVGPAAAAGVVLHVAHRRVHRVEAVVLPVHHVVRHLLPPSRRPHGRVPGSVPAPAARTPDQCAGTSAATTGATAPHACQARATGRTSPAVTPSSHPPV